MQPSKTKERYSSEFGFKNNMTMVSYVPNKGKAVILLSTLHKDKSIHDGPKKKPEIISYYNQTKGGVDTMDEMVRYYSCKRQTKRWPMVLWYNMLDVAVMNAYTLFKGVHPEYMNGVNHKRRLFLKELVKELVMPHMTWRQKQPALKRHVKEAMTKCGLVFSPMIQPRSACLLQIRKRCQVCPTAKDRKVSSCCSKCQKPLCKDHSSSITTVICYDCVDAV